MLVVVVAEVAEVLVVVLSMLGRVEILSWSFAVWAAGAVESELRRGGSGGAVPAV